MDPKAQRKHLNDYTSIHHDMVLIQEAIDILDRVGGGMRSVIETLRRKQQGNLRRLDSAAAKLEIPYPSKTKGDTDGHQS